MAKEKKRDALDSFLDTAVIARKRLVAAKALLSGELSKYQKNRATKGGVRYRIIQYQRIIDPPECPFPVKRVGFVSPATFEKQLEYLCKNCSVFSLPDLMAKLFDYQEIPNNAVAITFDGGHLDNYYNAVPLLLKYGVPGSFFVATAFIDSGGLFFEDRLTIALLKLAEYGLDYQIFKELGPALISEVATVSTDLKITTPSIPKFLLCLKLAPAEIKFACLKIIDKHLDDKFPPPVLNDFCSWEQLRELQTHGFSIGTMGHRHLLASEFEPEQFITDVAESCEALVKQGITLPKVYCFLEGIHSEVSLDILEQARIPFALTLGEFMEPRYQHRLPMLLGRVPMYEAVSFASELFACRLWGYTTSGITY